MEDPQIAKLNQQIAEYNNRCEFEKKRYAELYQKVIQTYNEYQSLQQAGTQETNPNPIEEDQNALKAKLMKDFHELQSFYSALKYERFKREIGEVKSPAELQSLLNTAASFLIQFNESMPKLITQRENRIDRCLKLQSEIAAIQKDIQPIRQQAKNEIQDSRQQTLSIKNKINFLQIDKINKRLKHFSDRYQNEVEIANLEGKIASSQTRYVSQMAALQSLQYVSILLENKENLTDEQTKHIIDQTDDLDKMFKFKDKNNKKKALEKINKAVDDLNNVRNNATNKINEILVGFTKIAQLENSTISQINECKTKSDMTDLEISKISNDIKRFQSMNQSLASEIEEYKKDVKEIEEDNLKLQDEIKKSEEYRSKTKEDMDKIEKDLKQKRKEKENLLLESKKLENEYEKSSSDFISALNDLLKANSNPELKKRNDEIAKQIKDINTKMKEVRLFNDIDMPYNNFLLSDVKTELDQVKSSRNENVKITNVQLFYNSQPGNMFSVVRVPSLPFYIVKTAHIKLALDAVFYPNNIDPLYPGTIVVATLIGKYIDIILLASSIITVIDTAIKSDVANIDPNTIGQHTPQEMVQLCDKDHPYLYNKLLPYIKEKPLTVEDVINRGLAFLYNLIKVHPVSESIKKDVKNLLKLADNKIGNPTEYSQKLKSLLGFDINPKDPKKKRQSTYLKKGEEKEASYSLGAMFIDTKIDEKDRKPDILVTKKSMSFKEKEIDRISLVDVNTLSDLDFYNLFAFIQFNTYQKLAAVDLVLNYRIDKKSHYIEEMIDLQNNTIKFIKLQIKPKESKNKNDDNNELTIIKRWLRIAKIARNKFNLFFFDIIITALSESKDFKQLKVDLAKDAKELEILTKIEPYLKDQKFADDTLAEIKKVYNNENSNNWFYIPSFQGQFSTIKNFAVLISDKSYKTVNNIVHLQHVREIADQLYFALSGIHAKVEFVLNPDIIRALEKKILSMEEST